MTDIVRGLQIGLRWLPHMANFNINGTHTLTSSTHGWGVGFRARDTNPITHLGFLYNSRTGTPPTYRISLQGMDATNGRPDGTVKGGGTPASATFTPPADTTWNSIWQWISLDNSYTPTLGEELCFWVDYSSGTVNASNYSGFTVSLSTGAGLPQNEYYPLIKLASGTYTKSGVLPVFGIRTASTRYGNIMQSSYNSRSASTVGHRQAMTFALPSGIFSSYQVSAVRFCGSIASAAAKNPLLKIWDGDGTTVMQSITLDSDIGTNPSVAYNLHELQFGTPASLTPGTTYYAGLEVADATSGGVLINGIQLNGADDRDSWEGGTNIGFATYNGSSWTADSTVFPFMQLTVNGIVGGGSTSYVIGG